MRIRRRRCRSNEITSAPNEAPNELWHESWIHGHEFVHDYVRLIEQLEQSFPAGVCDYGKPGVDQQGAIPWLTYEGASGNDIPGGHPVGPPPTSQPLVGRNGRNLSLLRGPWARGPIRAT
jgi:hypothetical protein